MRLTVPVLTKGKYHQKIRDARIDHTQNWKHKHLKNIKAWYEKAPYFDAYYSDLAKIYDKNRTFLIDLDMEIVFWLCNSLGLQRKTMFSSSLNVTSTDKQDRILEICHKVKADFLYDGHSARHFIQPGRFDDGGVTVAFYAVFSFPASSSFRRELPESPVCRESVPESAIFHVP